MLSVCEIFFASNFMMIFRGNRFYNNFSGQSIYDDFSDKQFYDFVAASAQAPHRKRHRSDRVSR